jgi:rare lipoprotein A (peptidoglycan hydrolase)
MMVLSKTRRAKRVRLARIGLSASALAAMALTPAEAKTPGSTYCYHGTCHRVKTIEETQALVGVEETIVASHYDDCSRDRYNPCGLTSSGERFHPERPDNTASPIYPDGTTLLVWSPETLHALIVRVNNAGPYWGNRELDLSRAAAEKLGFEKSGVAKVRVRVIKAPEPAEAKYVDNRTYPPVPGDIGQYASLAQAETGMAVALALEATAASPMAPVTTANAFGRQDVTGPLVAEAPQALGRGNLQVASLTPFFTAGLKKPRQSRRQLAALSTGRELNQSLWGEDVLDDLAPLTEVNRADVRKPETPWLRKSGPLVEVASEPVPKPVPAIRPVAQAIKVAAAEDDAKLESKPATEIAAEPVPTPVPAIKPVAQPTKVAALESDDKPESKRNARRQSRTESSSRRTHARDERRGHSRRASRSGRRSQPTRVVFADRPRTVVRERSAGQLMSLGIRAQSSSTM